MCVYKWTVCWVFLSKNQKSEILSLDKRDKRSYCVFFPRVLIFDVCLLMMVFLWQNLRALFDQMIFFLTQIFCPVCHNWREPAVWSSSGMFFLLWPESSARQSYTVGVLSRPKDERLVCWLWIVSMLICPFNERTLHFSFPFWFFWVFAWECRAFYKTEKSSSWGTVKCCFSCKTTLKNKICVNKDKKRSILVPVGMGDLNPSALVTSFSSFFIHFCVNPLRHHHWPLFEKLQLFAVEHCLKITILGGPQPYWISLKYKVLKINCDFKIIFLSPIVRLVFTLTLLLC